MERELKDATSKSPWDGWTIDSGDVKELGGRLLGDAGKGEWHVWVPGLLRSPTSLISSATRRGHVAGTSSYMSEEQVLVILAGCQKQWG